MVGFHLATRSTPTPVNPAPPAPQPTAEIIPGIGSEQHNVMVVQVDQLDAEGPRLESVWFVSIFFMENVPPSLTFVQLYSPSATSENARAIERAFSLNPGGEPGEAFWKALEVFEVPYEGYFLVDRFSAQRLLEWANGPGDHVSPLADPQNSRLLLEQTCQSISGISLRETTPFDWTGLAPKHFRSNMRMEKAVDYWRKLTSSETALRCDMIVTP